MILGNTVIISAITAIGIIISLLNQVLIAKLFGTSLELDSYLMVSSIPMFFAGAAVPFFSTSIVPISYNLSKHDVCLNDLITVTTLLNIVFIIVFSITGFNLQYLYISLCINTDPTYFNKLYRFLCYFWTIAGISIFNGYLSCLFNIRKSFIVPAVVQIAPSIGMVLGLLIGGRDYGIIAMIMGWLISSFLSTLILLPAIFKCKFMFKVSVKIWKFISYNYIKSLIPVGSSLLPFGGLPIIDAYWAYQLGEGNLSCLGYCTRIVVAIGSVIVNGLGLVIVPYLSNSFSEGDNSSFHRICDEAVRSILLISVPLILFLIFANHQIVEILFLRGEFDSIAANKTSDLLVFYLLGLIFMMPGYILAKVVAAKSMYSRMLMISVIAIMVYFTFSGVLINFFSVYGIGVAYTAYWVIYLALTLMVIDVKILSSSFIIFTLKLILSTIVSASVIYFLRPVNHSIFTTVLLFIVYISVFVFTCMSLKLTELNNVISKLTNKFA